MFDWVTWILFFIAGGCFGALIMAIVGAAARGRTDCELESACELRPDAPRELAPWRRPCPKCAYFPGWSDLASRVPSAPSHHVAFDLEQDMLAIRCSRCGFKWYAHTMDKARPAAWRT